jgi:hypothetical protein
VFIAVRLVTVGPRVTASNEGRTFRYILRDVTNRKEVILVQIFKNVLVPRFE